MRRPGPGPKQRSLPLSRLVCDAVWRYRVAGDRVCAGGAPSRVLLASVTLGSFFLHPRLTVQGPHEFRLCSPPRPAFAHKQSCPRFSRPTAGTRWDPWIAGPDGLQNQVELGPSYVRPSALFPSLVGAKRREVYRIGLERGAVEVKRLMESPIVSFFITDL